MQVSRRLLDVAHRLDQARTGAEGPMGTPAGLEADVVPIESLAPDAPPAPETSALEASFRTLKRLERERGAAQPSLEALAGVPQPVEAVAIESLCYRGRSALERAGAVRGALAAELAAASDLAAIRPLLQELLDLVPLALDES